MWASASEDEVRLSSGMMVAMKKEEGSTKMCEKQVKGDSVKAMARFCVRKRFNLGVSGLAEGTNLENHDLLSAIHPVRHRAGQLVPAKSSRHIVPSEAVRQTGQPIRPRLHQLDQELQLYTLEIVEVDLEPRSAVLVFRRVECEWRKRRRWRAERHSPIA